MLIVCNKKNCQSIGNIFKKWDLEYNIIEKTNLYGCYNVYDKHNLLYKKINEFNDVNDYTNIPTIKQTIKNQPIKIKDMEKWQVYDSTVGNRTIKGPDKPGSYSVLDIHEVNKQLVLTWGETFDECYDTMKLFKILNHYV